MASFTEIPQAGNICFIGRKEVDGKAEVCLLDWRAHKQYRVVHSTFAAETLAGAEAMDSARYLQLIFMEFLGIKEEGVDLWPIVSQWMKDSDGQWFWFQSDPSGVVHDYQKEYDAKATLQEACGFKPLDYSFFNPEHPASEMDLMPEILVGLMQTSYGNMNTLIENLAYEMKLQPQQVYPQSRNLMAMTSIPATPYFLSSPRCDSYCA